MAENDKEDVIEEMGSAEDGGEAVQEKAEESKEATEEKTEENNTVTRNYPANKYELAIVAAQEARRLNESWKDPEERRAGKVTAKALEKARKGEIHFTVPNDQDN